MRRAARKDANHKEIADALKAAGYSVFDAAGMGVGFPDLVVGGPLGTVLVECKAPGGRLTKAQKAFHSKWKGGQVLVITSPEQALLLVPHVCGRPEEF